MPLTRTFARGDILFINLMGIVCDFNYLCFQQKPTPNPSKEGNSILRENNIITFKSRRVNIIKINESAFFLWLVGISYFY
jgi:hypothetical protein